MCEPRLVDWTARRHSDECDCQVTPLLRGLLADRAAVHTRAHQHARAHARIASSSALAALSTKPNRNCSGRRTQSGYHRFSFLGFSAVTLNNEDEMPVVTLVEHAEYNVEELSSLFDDLDPFETFASGMASMQTRKMACGACQEQIIAGGIDCEYHGTFCRSCIFKVTEQRIVNGRPSTVGCPVDGCEAVTKQPLVDWARSLQNSPQLRQRRRRIRHERVAELFISNPDLAVWAMAGNAQVCPGCFSLVERDSGCSHMMCRCDESFCYICGSEYPCRNKACQSGDLRCHIELPTSHVIERCREQRMALLMGTHARVCLLYTSDAADDTPC
eukprot:5608361-Pleurochrysis_carterae.AAC.5